MSRPLVAGNWKMYGTRAEADGWVREIVAGAPRAGVDLLLLPPFTLLESVGQELRRNGGSVLLGAQDVHEEDRGAYTGEVSAPMLVDLGCRFVLVGHSERRTYFGESGAMLLSKLRAALRNGLTPILCVGERLEEREGGRMEQVLAAQLAETVLQLEPAQAAGVVLAYEPVWAIGTGRNATPEQAEQAHAFLRARMAGGIGGSSTGSLPILYGGSVNGGNAAALLTRPGIDGALVGGASLRPAEFLTIARAAADAH